MTTVHAHLSTKLPFSFSLNFRYSPAARPAIADKYDLWHIGWIIVTIPPAPGDSLSRREKLLYILLLGALTALGPFTVDLYLPAFPALERHFDVSAAAIQLTLTGTTVGFAIGQLVVGPFSDKFGRRMPLILATALHIGSSLGAALSTDISTLALFRVLMGVGAAGGSVVAMAMVRDLFAGYAMVRMFSRMSLVNGLAPILAPIIGSQLLLVVPWPGIFYFLASYGFLVIIAAVFLIRETYPAELRRQTTSTAAQRYKAVFADRIFVGMLLVGGLNFGGLFAYLSASTFLFQQVYNFSPQEYGLLFGINSLGIVAGVQISSRVIRRVAPPWIMAYATVWMLLMAVFIVVFDLLHFGLWGVMVPLWFYISRHRIHVPLRPGDCLGQPWRAGRHSSFIAGCLQLPDGRNHPAGGRLVGRRLRRSHGGRPSCLHRRRHGGALARRAATDRPLHPLMSDGGMSARERPVGSSHDAKPHRNGRGLFLGAVLGAVVGFLLGRGAGNPIFGALLGAVVGSAILYRLNPGPWKRD